MRLILFLLLPSLSLALASFSGMYGGAKNGTYIGAKLTNNSLLKRIEIAGLSSACTIQLPLENPIDETRSTTITRSETPSVRVRSNGKFDAQFQLNSESRVDFKGATVNLRGRLRGGTGRVTIELIHNKTYEDSSSEICYGVTTIRLRRS